MKLISFLRRLWNPKPEPVTLSFDAESILIARPGDLVLLHVDGGRFRHLFADPIAMAQIQEQVRESLAGLRVCFVLDTERVEVVPSATVGEEQ